MSFIACPNCGHQCPEGSHFCNQCGAQIAVSDEVECPACHSMIPADSIFCPVCRNMMKKSSQQQSIKLEKTEVKPASKPKRAPIEFGAREAVTGTAAGAAPASTPNTGSPATGSTADQTTGGGKNWKQYLILAGILAFLALFVWVRCFRNSKPDRQPEATNTENAVSVNNSTDIFNRALEEYALKGDGDKIAYALRLMNSEGQPSDKIMGVTYLSEENNSFYRIYTLTKNGSRWEIERNKQEYINGRKLIFDPAEMRSDEVPSQKNINGKEYFCYAFLNMPQSMNGNGIVTIGLVDVETGNIASKVNYEGEIVVTSDGQRQIIGRNTNATNGILDSRIKEYAQGIGYLHIPTKEELDAEKEAAEEEAAKKELEGPANADRRWLHDNAGALEALESGEEVHTAVTSYDKSTPLFKAEDFQSKINSPGYVVFLGKNGVVYAFNKSTDANFVVYAGGSKATQIGFENSEKGILNIRTANGGRLQYDLVNHTIKKRGGDASDNSKPAEVKREE